MPLPQPVLAVEIGVLVFVVFVIIGIIKAILQAAGGQAGAGKRALAPRQDRLKDEIENFLREAGGKKRPAEPPREVVAEAPPARPQRAQPLPPQRRPPRRPAVKRPALTSPPPGRDLETRHLERGVQLGEGVRGHLGQYMEERVAGTVQQHLGSTEEGRHAAAQFPRPGQAAAHPLLSLLRSPEGMRQAIVLNEILTRPSQRRR